MSARWKVGPGEPRAGRHYPGTTAEFEAWFHDEPAARAYLEAVRFRGDRSCPKCRSALALGGPRGMWCPGCRRHLSLTSGTLMQGTRLPAKTWLAAAWHLTQTKVGMSATGFAESNGLSYTSTWLLFHKLRSAMDQTGREKLSGNVEIDETYVGGREPGVRGRATERKSLVIVGCEFSDTSWIGRTRLERAHSASTLSIKSFIAGHVEPGSILYSDGALQYASAVNELAEEGLVYRLHQTNQLRSDRPPDEMLPRVHRVVSLFKRQQLGTFQGAISTQHLDSYLDEFTFRFNRRTSRSRGLLFWRLVCALTAPGDAVRYTDLRERKTAQETALKAQREADAAHLHEQHRRGVNHQYQRRKAAKKGLPQPASPRALRADLRHEELEDAF